MIFMITKLISRALIPMHEKLGLLIGLNSSDTTAKFLSKLLSRGGTVIDVGANRGDFASLCRQTCMQVKLVLIEPQIEMQPLLEKIMKEGDLFFPIALSNEQYRGYIDRKNIGDRKASLSEQSTELSIEVSTLDHIIADYGLKKVDLVKIDTEGNDFQVILGAQKSIQESVIDKILFEVNFKTLVRGELPQDIESWLRERGFRHFYRTTKWFGFIPLRKLENYRVENQNILCTKEPL